MLEPMYVGSNGRWYQCALVPMVVVGTNASVSRKDKPKILHNPLCMEMEKGIVDLEGGGSNGRDHVGSNSM